MKPFPLILPIILMAIVVAVSNRLANVPFNDWLVWGAFTYPFAFLVTDLTNRMRGAADARKVVLVGFAIGLILSLMFADTRIALASAMAFLCSQLLDVSVFDRIRQRVLRWWVPPLLSSTVSSILDTTLFFSLAFAGTGVPWQQWAIGDLGVKWLVALLALLPYGAFVGFRSERTSDNMA